MTSSSPGSRDNDPLLARLFAAAEAGGLDEAIADLLAEQALPVVDRILATWLRRFGRRGAELREDLRGDVIVRLLGRLRRLLDDPAAEPIHSFRDYVAVVTYHRLDDFVRRSEPGRYALSNRVRFLLLHDPRFALWSPNERLTLAGLAAWRDEDRPPTNVSQHLDVVGAGDRPRLADAVQRLLMAAGGPVAVGELIAVLAEQLDVEQLTATPGVPLHLAIPVDPLSHLESQQYLRQLWDEIVTLPRRQRVALLLNLRDTHGDSVYKILQLTGAASRHAIAAALELDPAELARLWPDLPVEDARIGELLGLARQQVINLRKCARERLARRMTRRGWRTGSER